MVGLLLDEHLSPKIAAGLRRMNLPIAIHSMNEWKGGRFLGRTDAECLAEAAQHGFTFVTYDCRTIPTLLKAWREQGRSHAGILYIDQKTISSDDIGSLVRALAWVVREFGGMDWTDREEFLRYV
jgi:PIN like domain